MQDIFILLWRDLKNGYGLVTVNLRLYHHAIKKVLNFFNDNNITDRLVFVLKQHEGFDFGDISEITRIDIDNVRNSFKAGLKKEAG